LEVKRIIIFIGPEDCKIESCYFDESLTRYGFNSAKNGRETFFQYFDDLDESDNIEFKLDIGPKDLQQ
jgi:hypothetical protein